MKKLAKFIFFVGFLNYLTLVGVFLYLDYTDLQANITETILRNFVGVDLLFSFTLCLLLIIEKIFE